MNNPYYMTEDTRRALIAESQRRIADRHARRTSAALVAADFTPARTTEDLLNDAAMKAANARFDRDPVTPSCFAAF